MVSMSCFNPRTHEGCDPLSDVWQRCRIVSIHAPTKGATTISACTALGGPFQSTHPRRVRHQSDAGTSTSGVSIHAPTKGATPRPRLADGASPSFNPRTHEGCDFATNVLTIRFPCFNPRTHEGCDLVYNTNYILPESFNPRTHEGCDV